MTPNRQAAAIAALATAGIITILATSADEIGGAITGAAITTAAASRYLTRHTKALNNAQARYDAAYATLGSQRERLRVAADEHVATQLAELAEQHELDIVRARAEGYLQAAAHARDGVTIEQPPRSAGAHIIRMPARPHTPAGADR